MGYIEIFLYIPKAICYLLKGDYKGLGFREMEAPGLMFQGSLYRGQGWLGRHGQVTCRVRCFCPGSSGQGIVDSPVSLSRGPR